MRYLFAALLVLLPSWGWAQTPLQWQPARTWVFMVGVAEWKDKKDYDAFDQAGRRDGALLKALQQDGVPPSQTVYLRDGQATLKNIKQSLGKTLGSTRPGDWLILYYAGHGWVDDQQGTIGFANYDATNDDYWTSTDIWKALRRFQGSHALVLVDCCSSGGLADQLRHHPTSFATSVLTASDAHESSTGDWTFTQALADAFGGSPLEDLNHDGWVDLGEMIQYAREDMAVFHEQMAATATTGDLAGRVRLVPASGQLTDPKAGQRLEVLEKGEWWPARVIASKGSQLKVHYTTAGYDTPDWDAWVDAGQTRPKKFTTYPVGSKVQAIWRDKWYPVTVLEVKGGLHRIHYLNFGTGYDEWVASARLKPLK